MRFRLRTFLLAIGLVSLMLGYFVSAAKNQRRAVEALDRIHFVSIFNSSEGMRIDSRFDHSAAQSSLTRRFDEWLGQRFFGRVIAVHGYDHSFDPIGDDRRFLALAKLADLPEIQLLHLELLRVTDRDLVHLRSLSRLRTLYLKATPISDSGIENIARLTELRRLGLQRTKITDAGVGHLQALKNLDNLNLEWTHATDASIPILSGLTKLTELNLSHTQVSDHGIAQLRRALPQTKIYCDR